MNSYWEESKTFVYDALNLAGKKTERVVKIQKLKYRLAKLNKQLESYYIKMGKIEYSGIKNNCDNDVEKKELVINLDRVLREIAVVRHRLEAESESKICPSCGYMNKKDATFCSGCAEKLD